MVFTNAAQWAGDYIAAGVVAVDAQIANFGQTDLEMGIAIQGPLSTRYGSSQTVLVPADGEWRNVSFGLGPDDLSRIRGSVALNDVLAAVTRIRIVPPRDGPPDWNGLRVAATLGLDNVTAVSEPATLNLKVETDKDEYHVGDTVNWLIWAGANSGTTRGVSLIGVDLGDDRGEAMSPAAALGGDFAAFGASSTGTTPPGSVLVKDIFAGQTSRQLDVAGDGAEHLFAVGSYEATMTGRHTLTVSHRSGNYWPTATANAAAFELIDDSLGDAEFNVIADLGDANGDGVVDDNDLSLLLANWNQDAGWDGGNFNGDSITDDSDLSLLLANWTASDPPGAVNVPEPATVAVLAAGLALPVLRRKR